MKSKYTKDNIGNKFNYNEFGELHSINDEPAMILESGEKRWYYKNLLHRETGPAVTIPGYENQYFFMGKKHRENGPAIENIEYEEYWINGIQINKSVFELNKKLEHSLLKNSQPSQQKRKI